MQGTNIVTRMNMGASRLRIVGLALILLAFVLFIYFTSKQEENIQIQRHEIIEKEAALSEKDAALGKVSVTETRREQLLSIVNEYLELRAKHDVNGLDNLYADRLDYYFKNLKNCTKEEVKRADTLYWQRFPQDAFALSDEPEITIHDNGTAKAIVTGRNCRDPQTCVDELVEIVFDTENKIKAVRGFIPKS